VIAIAIGLILLPPLPTLAAMLFATTVGAVLALWARRKLGGLTGDVLGAVQQLGEIAFLLAVVAMR
jgi:adenosylcobinamide-GDP ribazoletransferase